MASLRESKVMALDYINQHRLLPDYVKPLVKEIVIHHFQSLSHAIGVVELTMRRTEAAVLDSARCERRKSRRKKGLKHGK
jgi:hypothetical protein